MAGIISELMCNAAAVENAGIDFSKVAEIRKAAERWHARQAEPSRPILVYLETIDPSVDVETGLKRDVPYTDAQILAMYVDGNGGLPIPEGVVIFDSVKHRGCKAIYRKPGFD